MIITLEKYIKLTTRGVKIFVPSCRVHKIDSKFGHFFTSRSSNKIRNVDLEEAATAKNLVSIVG